MSVTDAQRPTRAGKFVETVNDFTRQRSEAPSGPMEEDSDSDDLSDSGSEKINSWLDWTRSTFGAALASSSDEEIANPATPVAPTITLTQFDDFTFEPMFTVDLHISELDYDSSLPVRGEIACWQQPNVVLDTEFIAACLADPTTRDFHRATSKSFPVLFPLEFARAPCRGPIERRKLCTPPLDARGRASFAGRWWSRKDMGYEYIRRASLRKPSLQAFDDEITVTAPSQAITATDDDDKPLRPTVTPLIIPRSSGVAAPARPVAPLRTPPHSSAESYRRVAAGNHRATVEESNGEDDLADEEAQEDEEEDEESSEDEIVIYEAVVDDENATRRSLHDEEEQSSIRSMSSNKRRASQDFNDETAATTTTSTDEDSDDGMTSSSSTSSDDADSDEERSRERHATFAARIYQQPRQRSYKHHAAPATAQSSSIGSYWTRGVPSLSQVDLAVTLEKPAPVAFASSTAPSSSIAPIRPQAWSWRPIRAFQSLQRAGGSANSTVEILS